MAGAELCICTLIWGRQLTFYATEAEPRAGFWRRLLSILTDVVIVGAPFQIVVAILFVATAGFVQISNSGFVIKTCQVRTGIPAGLVPPPPHDSNFATDCSYSFFGAQTGRSLTVGRAEKHGLITKTIFRTYMLNKAGDPIQGLSIDSYVLLVLIAYLVVLTTRTGQTLGDRLARIRVVDTAGPPMAGVPLRNAVARYAVITVGYIPLFAVLIIAGWISENDVEALSSGATADWLIGGAMVAAIWTVILVGQVALKRDPFYDRLAGTSVVKASPHDHVANAESGNISSVAGS